MENIQDSLRALRCALLESLGAFTRLEELLVSNSNGAAIDEIRPPPRRSRRRSRNRTAVHKVTVTVLVIVT